MREAIKMCLEYTESYLENGTEWTKWILYFVNFIQKHLIETRKCFVSLFWVQEANSSGHIISLYIAFQVATYSLRQYDWLGKDGSTVIPNLGIWVAKLLRVGARGAETSEQGSPEKIYSGGKANVILRHLTWPVTLYLPFCISVSEVARLLTTKGMSHCFVI